MSKNGYAFKKLMKVFALPSIVDPDETVPVVHIYQFYQFFFSNNAYFYGGSKSRAKTE